MPYGRNVCHSLLTGTSRLVVILERADCHLETHSPFHLSVLTYPDSRISELSLMGLWCAVLLLVLYVVVVAIMAGELMFVSYIAVTVCF